MKKIVLTGGGTAGHVTANVALLPFLKNMGFEIYYIGSKDGMEKDLIAAEGVPYYGIDTGKLRRYISKKNISDGFKVFSGVAQAKKIIKDIKPDLVFSKGGFVAVPVCLATRLNKVKLIVHESDMTPGLANKISIPFAEVVCTTFAETLQHIPSKRKVYTGSPIRKELLEGVRKKGFDMCGFSEDKPVVLMMGGSLGAAKLNNSLRDNLERLLERFNIIHLCGKGGALASLECRRGYKQFEYVREGLADLFAITDIIVSRAGSNSICEFLALKKPMLLIPLSKKASRGDQILNAESFERNGFAKVLREEDLNNEAFYKNIIDLFSEKQSYVKAMEGSSFSNGAENVLRQIENIVRRK